MKVSTCCGCWTLRTGTIITGCLHFIGGLALIIFESLSIQIYNNMEINDANVTHPNITLLIVCMYEKLMAVGLLVYSIIALIMSIVLIIGAARKNPNLIFLPLCTMFTSLVLSLMNAISQTSILISYNTITPAIIIVLWFIIGLSYSVTIYLFMVIYSYYEELVAEKLGHATNNCRNISKHSADDA